MDDDELIGPDDREEALRRGFTQHDTLTFMGKRMRPMTAGTLDLLQKTGNRLLAGGQETPFSDIAGFALLHIADEDEHRIVRNYVWRGKAAWNEYVYQFLNDTPCVEAELRDASPAFRQIISDYTNAITRPANAENGKKIWSPGWLAWFVATVAKETGWSFHSIMWEIPASASMQVYDVFMSQHVELRWINQRVDIDALLDGQDFRS